MNKLEIISEKQGEVELCIHNNNLKWTRFVLLSLLLIMCSFPLLGIYFATTKEDVEGGRVFLGILLWIGAFLLFYRLIFWGLWGKEYITVSDSKVKVRYDYKLNLVKTNPIVFEGENVWLEFERSTSVRKKKMVKLRFQIDNEQYLSVLNIPFESIDQLTFRSDIDLKIKTQNV